MQDVVFDKKSAIVVDKNSFAEICVGSKTGSRFLRSILKIKKNSIITSFKVHAYFTEPNCFTIQINHNTHISLFPYCLKYINHSCEPNVFFDCAVMRLIAIKDIEAGDELRYFYPSTELKMAQPFSCECGSKNCLGEINGAHSIPKDVLKNYIVSDFIKTQVLDK